MTRTVSRARRVSGNVLVTLASLVLIGSSFAKFAAVPAVADGMARLGFAGGKLQMIAVLELASGLLFLIPRTRAAGLLVASSYLGGAIATHVAHADPHVQPAIAVLALFWIAVAVRNPEASWSFA